MNIQTVKQQSNGYLINNSMSIPNDPNNRHYKLVQEYITNGGTVEPEFTEEELANKQIQETLSEYKTYLTNTDYKFLQGYVPKDGEDLAVIEATRNEYREYIRINEVTV
jgi:hypothetical protein